MSGPDPLSAGSSRMRVAVILNGISLRKKYFYQTLLPAISAVMPVEVFETRSKLDAISLAAKARQQQMDIVIAAGGDGTLNQVVNGLLQQGTSGPVPMLGIIPLGSGNDFARVYQHSRAREAVVAMLSRQHVVSVDLGKIIHLVNGEERLRYFINIADVGMGPEVVRRLNESDRLLGSAVAYYSSIIKNFFTYKSIDITITTDQWNWDGKIRTFAIANGKCFGHGLCVAPDAVVTDGLFETFLVGDVSVLDFIRYSGTLKSGRKIKHAQVTYGKAGMVEVSSQEKGLVEADGELVGELPIRIEMMPQAIRLLV